jgi:DNA-directed RNA polymerase
MATQAALETTTETTPSKRDLQIALENEMRANGTAKFRAQIARARRTITQGGHHRDTTESETKYGSGLLAGAVVPVARGIDVFKSEAHVRAGRPHAALAYLDLLDSDVAAYIACKVIIDGITMPRGSRLQAVAIKIGGMIEDEVRFQAFENGESINPRTGQLGKLRKLFEKISKGLDADSADYERKRTVLGHSMGKAGLEWVAWPKTEKLHLGIKLIEIVEETTQMVQHTTIRKGKNTDIYLEATEALLQKIQQDCERDEVLCPEYQPMILPPVDWDSPIGGGYLSGRKLTFVKSRRKEFHEEITSTNLDLCYNAVNGLQRTAWKVNKQVFEVLEEIWRHTDYTFGELPERERVEMPPKPHDIATNEVSRREWRHKASQAHKDDRKRKSKWLQVNKVLMVAQKFKDEPELYFPYTVDFRGRVYAVPMFLNPQGHDTAKGLLTFAHGKPLGDELAVSWLAIHGANLFGFDKVSLEERVKWVNDHGRLIVESAKAPLDYLWWAEADKPWQFLAFCFEWYGYVKDGLEHVSYLPIALDGSCNGLQHFSAMLRDPIGGAAVNLTPSDKPQDIYQTVADRVSQKLAASSDPWAHIWVQFKINRDLTKRPVMVVPYGGTRHSGRDYIVAEVKKRIAAGEVNLFTDDTGLFEACNFLSGLVWDAISETVVAARDAMGWLQQVAKIVGREEKPLNWTAPTGFKVQQAYPEVETKRVDTQIAGSIIKLNLNEDQDSLDKRRQAQGISPNFVHSLDAAALMFTVDTCLEAGLDSFGMVHDSYATVAADTDTLRECLRQSFCQMYHTDVLKNFRDEIQEGLPPGVELPPLPQKGTLDINLVLKSDFFFA